MAAEQRSRPVATAGTPDVIHAEKLGNFFGHFFMGRFGEGNDVRFVERHLHRRPLCHLTIGHSPLGSGSIAGPARAFEDVVSDDSEPLRLLIDAENRDIPAAVRPAARKAANYRRENGMLVSLLLPTLSRLLCPR